jgi:L-lactate utilization protein LutB
MALIDEVEASVAENGGEVHVASDARDGEVEL